MSQILDVLNEMRTRKLGMYVGSTSLTRLGFFLLGYEHAVCRLMPDNPDRFLADFREWIYQRFNTRDNIGWEETILRHSADDANAVERFWDLLDEYVKERGSRNVAAVSPCPASGIGSADLSSSKGQGK